MTVPRGKSEREVLESPRKGVRLVVFHSSRSAFGRLDGDVKNQHFAFGSDLSFSVFKFYRKNVEKIGAFLHFFQQVYITFSIFFQKFYSFWENCRKY